MTAVDSHKVPDDATPPTNAGGGVLYIVATPIGNLGDFSTRAIATLKAVNVIACEDTRVTGVLLHRHAISTRMVAYHDHNADRMRPQILARLTSGESFALVSDAGTPLISDPGYKLVRDCVESGIPIIPIPGASAPLAALMAAGLPTDRFYFGGFLPNKAKARKAALENIRALSATLVFFESPHRLADTLTDMAEVLGERGGAVGREITKLHEEFRRSSLKDLAAHYQAHNARGEIVIVVAGASEDQDAEEIDIRPLLVDALKTMSLRDAADAVAKVAGVPRRDVYTQALKLSKEK